MGLLATQIPDDVFETIAKNAGILLNEFDPETWTVSRSAIKGATTGGIDFKDAPSYTDYGEDIDNCPKGTMELQEIESREVTAASTYVSVRPAEIKNLVVAADKVGDKITPRNELKTSDFEKEIWFVTDYGVDGAIAIRLDNVMNTDGFALKTTDKGKGNFAFNYKAHYSIKDPDKVPYEIFIKEGTKTE